MTKIERRVYNVTYRRNGEPDDNQIVDSQYDASDNSLAHQAVVITGSISQKPGAYINNPLDDSQISYVDSATTQIIFASGGHGDEYIMPVRSAWEQGDIPIETTQVLPLHATYLMIASENLEAAAGFEDTMQEPHTHHTTPTNGSFATPEQKRYFSMSQIRQAPPAHKIHHRYKPGQLISEDGIDF